MGAGSNLSNGALGGGRRGLRLYRRSRWWSALWRVATLLVFAGNTLAFCFSFF
jgi:hypothetical protein